MMLIDGRYEPRNDEEREIMAKKPLAIDLFCGLGGWTDGLLAEGYDVIGYDIEDHAPRPATQEEGNGE